MKPTFTFGSDPEVMLMNQVTGHPVSAIRLLKGCGKSSKYALGGDQYMFYDNVLLEFNIAPAETFRQFADNIYSAFSKAATYFHPSASLVFAASADFAATERLDPEAAIFGCDPEYNIYRRNPAGKMIRMEPPKSSGSLRTCGGHIHIGHPIATVDSSVGGNPPLVVKLMDGFVGITSLLIDHDPSGEKRREMYGGAGTHRITNYGLEYRTLSNFWLASPTLANIIYQLTRQVIELAMTNPNCVDEVVDAKDLEDIINHSKKDDALLVFSQLQKHLACELVKDIEYASAARLMPWTEEWTRYAKEKPPLEHIA